MIRPQHISLETIKDITPMNKTTPTNVGTDLVHDPQGYQTKHQMTVLERVGLRASNISAMA